MFTKDLRFNTVSTIQLQHFTTNDFNGTTKNRNGQFPNNLKWMIIEWKWQRENRKILIGNEERTKELFLISYSYSEYSYSHGEAQSEYTYCILSIHDNSLSYT